jgi:hypothetical protein
MSKHVDVHHGSTSEQWITIHDDGSLFLHTENEGPRILRHGVEARDEPPRRG